MGLISMANKKFKPTDEQRQTVSRWVANGIPLREISAFIGCSYGTLKIHFAREIKTGSAEATSNVATRLYEKAMEGNVKALMFWLERRGGETWISKQQISYKPTVIEMMQAEEHFTNSITMKVNESSGLSGLEYTQDWGMGSGEKSLHDLAQRLSPPEDKEPSRREATEMLYDLDRQFSEEEDTDAKT